jgi:hypothetical protein
MSNPLGRDLFRDAEMVRTDSTTIRGGVVALRPPVTRRSSWRAAALALGISAEEYAEHRARGERRCYVGKHWTTETTYAKGCREHVLAARRSARQKEEM